MASRTRCPRRRSRRMRARIPRPRANRRCRASGWTASPAARPASACAALPPLAEIAAVHEHGFDTVTWQQRRDDPVARAEQRARSDHPVARFQMRHHRGIHRRHAGRGRPAGFRAFQQGEALLQHRNGRIGEAGILVVLDRVLERRLGLLGAVIDEAQVRKSASVVSPNAERSVPPCTSRVAGRWRLEDRSWQRGLSRGGPAGSEQHRRRTVGGDAGLFSALVSPRRNPAGQITRAGISGGAS